MNVKKRIALALLTALVFGCALAATIQILMAYLSNPETVLLQFNGRTFTGSTIFDTDIAWLPLVWASLALTAFVGLFIGAGVLAGVAFMLASLVLPLIALLAFGYFVWKYRGRIAGLFS